jgi:hypothetical protein
MWAVCFVLVIVSDLAAGVHGDDNTGPSLSDQPSRAHAVPRVHKLVCVLCALIWWG